MPDRTDNVMIVSILHGGSSFVKPARLSRNRTEGQTGWKSAGRINDNARPVASLPKDWK